MEGKWTIRDYTYVATFAVLSFISSMVFGILAFLYYTPLFFIGDFAYSFPHALLIVICYLLVCKFPVWTYVSTVEGVIDCIVLGWSPIWLPLYVFQGLIPDLVLKFTGGYENPKLRHSIAAALIYGVIMVTVTWLTFLYVYKLYYPLWLICGSVVSCLIWITLGAITGHKLTPRVKEALKAR